MSNLFRIVFAAIILSVLSTALEAQVPLSHPAGVAFSRDPALRVALVRARAAQLRQAWLESGRPLPSKSQQSQITKGKVLTATVSVTKAPAAVSVSVTYKAPEGLNFLQVTLCSNAAPDQCVYAEWQTATVPVFTGGSVTMESYQFSLYAAPGTWTITNALILDDAGNFVDYATQAELQTVFSKLSFTVVNNGTSDTTSPLVSAGSILTPTVTVDSSGDASFVVSLTASDNLSGVQYAYIAVQPPAGSSNYSYGNYVYYTPAPITQSGMLYPEIYFSDNPPTGTWTIIGYEVCDVAGNCLYDGNAPDITSLFGSNTFVVQN